MSYLSHHDFKRCVDRYDGNYRIRHFSCWDQFLAMAFAQLTHRESLRDIEVCLQAHHTKLYHCGLSGVVKRSTLASANEDRDWRIYADFAHGLIQLARPLYADTDLGLELDQTLYALDSTTIDLCLSLFPWATFRSTKSAIKMHTLLDLRGEIPAFIEITAGKVHDLLVLDKILIEPGSFLVMDRAYIDFDRLYHLHLALVFFVTRAKGNFQFKRRYSHPVDKSTGVKCDQTIILTGPKTKTLCPIPLRRVRYYAEEADKELDFITNNFQISSLTVAKLFRYRWRVELFFKWIKQHLRIKRFFGTSETSVKTQLWIAISIYVLVAIVKKRLGLDYSLYTILQVLSLSLFEKTPILGLFSGTHYNIDADDLLTN
jgi:hypothetical protein